MSPESGPATKPAWRARLISARRGVSARLRAEETRLLTDALSAWADGRRCTVCGYVPIGTEPGSPAMLDGLRAAGCRVLLPVVAGVGPLDWTEYRGEAGLRPARLGLREPTGERLGASAIAEAELLLVPALAVDRSGVRLGRGAGYYDRSLPLASADATIAAVVRDAEVVDRLPAEPHDVRMTAALTPRGGFVTLR